MKAMLMRVADDWPDWVKNSRYAECDEIVIVKGMTDNGEPVIIYRVWDLDGKEYVFHTTAGTIDTICKVLDEIDEQGAPRP